jgi:hypothetical protein
MKLENGRISMMKDKEKVLGSIIMEERITRSIGERVSSSPVAKRVKGLIKGNHKI